MAEIDTDLLDAVLVNQIGKHAAQEVWAAYDQAVRDAGRPPVVVVDVPGLAPSAVRHFLLTAPRPVHMAMWREVGMFVSWLECRVAGEPETWEASTTHEHTPALLAATEQYDVSVEEVPRG